MLLRSAENHGAGSSDAGAEGAARLAHGVAWPQRTNVWRTATKRAPRTKQLTSVCAPVTPHHPRSADRGRVSSLPRWRGPVSRTLCASDGEKELPPMPRSRIEIYWKTPETAPEGVMAQVRVTDDSGSDYLLPYPCELTEDGWVNAASGKPLAVRVTYWKLYVETLPRKKRGKRIGSDQDQQNGD